MDNELKVKEMKWSEKCKRFDDGQHSIAVAIGELGALMGTCKNPKPYKPQTYFGWCMQQLINHHVSNAR